MKNGPNLENRQEHKFWFQYCKTALVGTLENWLLFEVQCVDNQLEGRPRGRFVDQEVFHLTRRKQQIVKLPSQEELPFGIETVPHCTRDLVHSLALLWCEIPFESCQLADHTSPPPHMYSPSYRRETDQLSPVIKNILITFSQERTRQN